MNGWVAVSIAAIIAVIVYSYYRQFSFSIAASVLCVALFAMIFAVSDTRDYTLSATFTGMAFTPHDLTDPARCYTVLTSMFSHAGFGHLFWNVLGLAFIGTAFEHRVGARPFIIICLVSGLCGTLLFAAFRWDEAVAAVGASGAISGVLGAFARTFPNERMSMILMFFPLPPMRIWTIVAIFILIQIFIAVGDTNIAVEAHVGGLIAGMAIAPYIVRMPLHRRVKRMISLNALRRLAKTSELKSIMRRIEDEEIPDIRSAWIEEFLKKAKCPHCGARIKISRDTITCERGHLL